MKTRLILWILAFVLILQISPLLAQEEEEEPLPPPRRPSAGKIGGAGGFTPIWLYWDVSAFNNFVPANAAKFSNTPMVLLGGQGYAYIMLVENLRVGGMGVGGNSKTSAVDLAAGVRRDLDVSVHFGGVTAEYAIPIFDRLDIVPGILLGGGSMDIKMTRDGGGFKTWNGLWGEYGSNTATSDVSRKLTGSFFVYQPSLNLEFALMRWMGLRAGVSYVGMSAPDWQLDEMFDVAGVPSSIKGSGWTISTGIFVGTFLF